MSHRYCSFIQSSFPVADADPAGEGVRTGGQPLDDALASREELLAELCHCRARLAALEAQRASGLSERLFGGFLEAAPDGYLLSDPAGVIRLANPVVERMFGYDPGELVGQAIEVLVPEGARIRHVGQRQGFLQHPAPRRMGIGLQLEGRRRDGTSLPVEISLSAIDTREGRFVASAIRDVTERRETERMLHHQAEALARSNDQLQQFAYVASHDLQEPLRMVSSYLQLLERRYSDKLDDDAREFIAFAVDGAKRMQALIQDLLTFSRILTKDEIQSRVALNDVVEHALKDLDIAVREAGALVQVHRLPTLTAEPSQMHQLFLNLIGNALKFRRPGVTPEVTVSARRMGEAWELSVKDNGIGLDTKYKDRIFQIFQRLHTRAEYPGTGIGLAICKRIVERQGGEIRVVSTLGEGTTFLFTLPDRRVP